MFSKKIKYECGNAICEIEESAINCPQDCKDLTELPEIPESEDQQTNLECSTGCLYNTNCLSFGIRVGKQYCGIENKFWEQKEKKEVCDNNFECQSGLCIDSMCTEKGLFEKFLKWFKSLF